MNQSFDRRPPPDTVVQPEWPADYRFSSLNLMSPTEKGLAKFLVECFVDSSVVEQIAIYAPRRLLKSQQGNIVAAQRLSEILDPNIIMTVHQSSCRQDYWDISLFKPLSQDKVLGAELSLCRQDQGWCVQLVVSWGRLVQTHDQAPLGVSYVRGTFPIEDVKELLPYFNPPCRDINSLEGERSAGGAFMVIRPTSADGLCLFALEKEQGQA